MIMVLQNFYNDKQTPLLALISSLSNPNPHRLVPTAARARSDKSQVGQNQIGTGANTIIT